MPTPEQLPDDFGKPTRGDVQKLAGWIAQLDQESATGNLRLLLKGRSKEAQKIFRNFERWTKKKREQVAMAKLETELVSVPATEPIAPPKPKPVPEKKPGLKHIRVIIYNLALREAEPAAAVALESFGKIDRVTVSSEDYFDLFRHLAAVPPSNAGTTHTLFLESGAAPNESFAEQVAALDPATPLALLRTEEQPYFEPDQFERWFAFQKTSPGLLVHDDFLKEDRLKDWARFYHLAPWSWALSEIERDARAIGQTEEVVLEFEPHDYNLSEFNRNWLAANRPEVLSELREPLAEWGSLLHDLVAAVVDQHREYFEKNAGYLAATAATGVRR